MDGHTSTPPMEYIETVPFVCPATSSRVLSISRTRCVSVPSTHVMDHPWIIHGSSITPSRHHAFTPSRPDLSSERPDHNTFHTITMSLRRSSTALLRRASAALLESQQTSMTSSMRSSVNSNASGGVFSLGARRAFASDADLQKTALYDFHVKNGGTCRRRVALGRTSTTSTTSTTTTRRLDDSTTPSTTTSAVKKVRLRRAPRVHDSRACSVRNAQCRRKDGPVCGLVNADPVQG